MMILDIDQEKRTELKLRSRMEHDGMTGLFNRETFIARVSRILKNSTPPKRHALIMLDIDEFKSTMISMGTPTAIRSSVRLPDS